MASEITVIRDFGFVLDARKVLNRLGEKRPDHKIDAALRRTLEEEKERLLSLLQPASIYLILNDDETNRHAIFDRAVKVALAVCTIGRETERETARLFQDQEVLRALILDSLASEAVKEVVWRTEDQIVRDALSLGLWPSKRFSPGYRGWDLREQRFVFEKVPADKIGVTLTESMMMVPRKTLSFRINLYSDRRLTTRKFTKAT